MNPAAMHLLEANPHKIDRRWICQNPSALSYLLKQDPDTLYWEILSENPGAVPLLERYPERVHWDLLARNPAAIDLLANNLDKLHLSSLAKNPNAIPLFCVPDYARMREANEDFVQDLQTYVLNPDRVSRFARKYGLSFHDYVVL
jgi:hypothetical protein